MTASDVDHDAEQSAGRMSAAPAGRAAGEPDHRAPLILLHVVAFGPTMWQPVLAELRTLDPGRRVFTVDLPGPGRSPAWPCCDIEGMTEGVHRAAEAAALRSPVVVGHCAAAVVATCYAARYPARGVINVAQCLRIERWAGLARSLAAVRAARVPYLFIAGHDLEPGYQDCLDRMLPQASVTIWPGSGDFPQLAHPRRFARCLAATAWWGRREAYGPFGADLRLLGEDATEGNMMTALTRSVTDRLRTDFGGQLIWPGDDGYDAARRVWNGAIDRRPALIARVSGAADVVTAVRFAREQGLPVSVRGGGHSAPGFAVADGALMIDMSALKQTRIDPAARTAVAGSGLLWSELDTATQAYGLATTGGVVGDTGIAGLTLGGGIGFMDRLGGLTCDNLLGAEVVTADGQVLQASEDDHPDLFWALRGGGGNFGVVTSFGYRLHPVTEAYGGLLGYTMDRAAEVLQAYREVSADAPDRLALYAGVVAAPPAPFVPEHLRGHRVVGLIPVYFGPAGEAARALAPLVAAAPPVLDLTKPMSYQEVQQLTDGLNPPGMHHYYTTEWLRGLDDRTIDDVVAAAADAPSPRSVVTLKRMGGAAGRVPAGATPFWYRDAPYLLDIHAQWAPGGPPEPHIAWARAARQAARRDWTGGGYVNFIESGPDTGRVRAAFGGNYARLAQIKAAYDPDNFFHINNNIPPAVPSGNGGRDDGN